MSAIGKWLVALVAGVALVAFTATIVGAILALADRIDAGDLDAMVTGISLCIVFAVGFVAAMTRLDKWLSH